jgi:hypothetical protein
MRLTVATAAFAIVGFGVPAFTPVTATAAPSDRGAAPATPCTPRISSIGDFQAQASQSVEIMGSCFGTGATLNQSNNFYLQIQDRSAKPPWSACYLEATDGDSCTVSSWTNHEITFNEFNGNYGGDHTLNPGDKLVVAVWNTQTLIGPTTARDRVVGTPPPRSHCIPKITSVGTFQPSATQDVDIKGSCPGGSAPFDQSNSVDLYIEDSSGSPTAWSACNGGAVDDLVTCTVTSWTWHEIVLTGFGGSYGDNGWVLHSGDQIDRGGLESSDGCRTRVSVRNCRVRLICQASAYTRCRRIAESAHCVVYILYSATR